MQHALKQKSEIFSDWIFKIILGNDLGHIFLMDLKCIVSLIIYHEKYHFLLELFSYTVNEVQKTSSWPAVTVVVFLIMSVKTGNR